MQATTRIGVDVGGTFTDLVLHDEARGVTWSGKRLTTPDAPGRAIVEGVERLLRESGTAVEQVHSIVHGTTLITNTLLERTGARVGLITTAGFRDVLGMGREIRYDPDDLYARPAEVLVPRDLRYGVTERIRADGAVHRELDEDDVAEAAEQLIEAGIESLAIAFLHSYANPAHELRARDIVAGLYPELMVTLSSEAAAEIREYERTNTACINAYVQPRVRGYLDGLEHDLAAIGIRGPLHVMVSGGGITTVEEAKAFPVRLLESGPAAGAMAAAFIARGAEEMRVASFDMGGTTAKVCLIEHGYPSVKHGFEAGRVDKFKAGSGLPLKLTVIDMIEIGGGGGTIAAVDDLGLLKVGPRSAGSVPGPIAYGGGGTLPTVTDSDLVLGFLDADLFLGGEMPLSVTDVEHAMQTQLAGPLGIELREAAKGVLSVVTESMAAATRMHFAEKGSDPGAYTLLAFGGAGPVHAYALAKVLRMRRIIVPIGAGVISAFGLLVAPPAVDEVRAYTSSLERVDWARVAGLYDGMERDARRVLLAAGAVESEITISCTADMRYVGQGFEIEVPLPPPPFEASEEPLIRAAFADCYRSLFGHAVAEAGLEMVNWRLAARSPESPISLAYRTVETDHEPRHRMITLPGFGELSVPVYSRLALSPGDRIQGPALFEEHESSFSVGPDATVFVDQHLNLVVDIEPQPVEELS